MPPRLTCFYCGDPVLLSRLEQDHFPIPACAGGTETVDACQQCHDLKDRTSWADLPAEMKAEFRQELATMGRASRIIIGQFMRMAFEAKVAANSVMKVRVSNSELGLIDEVTGPPTPLADYIARVAIPLLRDKQRVTLDPG